MVLRGGHLTEDLLCPAGEDGLRKQLDEATNQSFSDAEELARLSAELETAQQEVERLTHAQADARAEAPQVIMPFFWLSCGPHQQGWQKKKSVVSCLQDGVTSEGMVRSEVSARLEKLQADTGNLLQICSMHVYESIYLQVEPFNCACRVRWPIVVQDD